MPLLRPEPEHICAYCDQYTFKGVDDEGKPVSGGWAYCKHFKKWFANQQSWTEATPRKDRTTPVGKRKWCKWQEARHKRNG